MKNVGIFGLPVNTEKLVKKFCEENDLDRFQVITLALNKMFMDCIPAQYFGEYENILGKHSDVPIPKMTFSIDSTEHDQLESDIAKILRFADIEDALEHQGRLLSERLFDTDLHRYRVFCRDGSTK